jgi:serine/threonine protein kinase
MTVYTMKTIEIESRSFAQALIARDAARGLAFLHASGILHRDFKPENLLIFSLTETAEVLAKLADFGASRMLVTDATNINLTAAVGYAVVRCATRVSLLRDSIPCRRSTPIYMAPEVLRHEPYSVSPTVCSSLLDLVLIVLPAESTKGRRRCVELRHYAVHDVRQQLAVLAV